MRTLTPTDARRLVITRQHLHQTDAPMLDIIRDLGCLQLDPISAVARSHQLVLWSRLGQYQLADLDKLLWHDRALFEYWAHVASIVLTEDYPIHAYRMRRYPEGSWGSHFTKWIEDHADEWHPLHDYILARLRDEGPLPSRAFEDRRTGAQFSSGWTSSGYINRILDYLWHKGEIMVAGRQGIQRLWDVADRCLPEWTPRDTLPVDEIVRQAAQKAIRALGVARATHIVQHYTRSRYPDLQTRLDELEAAGRIERVKIIAPGEKAWPGVWYLHTADIPLLERIQAGDFAPRTVLLSPFDNLICDRKRTELMFDFEFRIEIYVPKEKRQYGYYVLPILHGDQIIGRIDPLMKRKEKRLQINAVYAEPGAPNSKTTVKAISKAVESLAGFLGAQHIDYVGDIPAAWAGLRRD